MTKRRLDTMALLGEMDRAGFTRHERNNLRLRNAAERLLLHGRFYYADDDIEIEHGVSGPFNDDERRAAE